jgi:broad specificity phosphatase PhoE
VASHDTAEISEESRLKSHTIMAKSIELRRHTDNDSDELSPEGIAHAVEIGGKLDGEYELFVSTGAQRATQTAACFLAGMGRRVPGGVVVDESFRSQAEDRWKEAYRRAGKGDIESFRAADPDLVVAESQLFAAAMQKLFDRLSAGGRALVVGHSPMLEAAVYGLAGEPVEPMSKGAGVIVTQDDGRYVVRRAVT